MPDFCKHVASVSSFNAAAPKGFTDLFSGLVTLALLIANVTLKTYPILFINGYGPSGMLLNM